MAIVLAGNLKLTDKNNAKRLIKSFEKWEEGAKADLKQGRGFCS